jgi:1,4-alpha-glucan branching enzyme
MPSASATLPFAAIDAIALAVHADPFAVLGPHEATADGETGVAVRAFRPYAVEMTVRTVRDDRVQPMTRLHPEGFFEAFLPAVALADLDYRLRATWIDGSSSEFDDPYRYGPVLTGFDQHLFAEGTHVRAFDRLGARAITHGTRGVHFAVWAPTARRVSVVGDFNGWDGRVHPMRSLVSSGVWEIFLPDLGEGGRYKFEILPPSGPAMLKADPYGRYFETPPQTASIVYTGDTPGRTTSGLRTVAPAGCGIATRCRSTKCTWAAGGAIMTGNRCPTGSWLKRWCRMSATWASRTSS